MFLIGFRKTSFKTQDGSTVNGWNFWVEDDSQRQGMVGKSADRFFITDAKFPIGFEASDLGRSLTVFFNRYGKVDQLEFD